MVSPPRKGRGRGAEPPLLLSAVLANPQSLSVSRKIANEGLRARQLAVSLCSIETPVASRSVHHAKMNKRDEAKRATARAERIDALHRLQRHQDSANGGGGILSKLVTQPLSLSPVQQLSLTESEVLTKEALGDLVNKYVYALGEEAASGVSSPAMPASPTALASCGVFPLHGGGVTTAPTAAGLAKTHNSPERSKAQHNAQMFLKRTRDASLLSSSAADGGDVVSRRQRDANLIDVGTKKLDDTMSHFVKECGFVTVNATPQELRARREEEEAALLQAKRQAREADQGYVRQAMVKEAERQVRHLLKHVVHIKNLSTTAVSVQDALEAKMQPQSIINYVRGAVNTAGGHSAATLGSNSMTTVAVTAVAGGGGLRRKNYLQPLSNAGKATTGNSGTSGPSLHQSHISSVDSIRNGGGSGGGGQTPAVLLQLRHHSFLALGSEALGGSSVLTNTIDDVVPSLASPLPHDNSQHLRSHASHSREPTNCSPHLQRTSTAAHRAALLSTISERTQFRLGVIVRCAVALVSLHYPTSRAFADRFRKGGGARLAPAQRLPLVWVSMIASMFPAWFVCSCPHASQIAAVVASWKVAASDDNEAPPSLVAVMDDSVDLQDWLFVCAMLLDRDGVPKETGSPLVDPSPFSASSSSSITATISPIATKQTPIAGGGASVCRGHELQPSLKDVVTLLLGELPVSCPAVGALASGSRPNGAMTGCAGGTTAAEVGAIHKLQLTRRIATETTSGRAPSSTTNVATGRSSNKSSGSGSPQNPPTSAAAIRYITGIVAGAMVNSSASYCMARIWTQWLPEVPFLAALTPSTTIPPSSSSFLPPSLMQRQHAAGVELSTTSSSSSMNGTVGITVDGVLAVLFRTYQALATTCAAAASSAVAGQHPHTLRGSCSCSAAWCRKRCEELRVAAASTSPLPLPLITNPEATPHMTAGEPAATLAAELWRVPASGGPPQAVNVARRSVSAASSTSSATAPSGSWEAFTPSHNPRKALAVLSPLCRHIGPQEVSAPLQSQTTAGLVLLSLGDLDSVFTQHFSAACGAVPTVPLPSHFQASSVSSHSGAAAGSAMNCTGSPLHDALAGMQVRLMQHHHQQSSGLHRSTSPSTDGSTSWSPNATLPNALSVSTHSSDHYDEYSTSDNTLTLAEQHMAMVAHCDEERSALLMACRAHLRSYFLASDTDRDGAWCWYEFAKCGLTALLATWLRQLHGGRKPTDVAAGIVDEFLAAHVFPPTLGATSMECRKRCEAMRQVLAFLDSECDVYGFVSTR
jgi:hypothetical protein